MVDAAKKRKQPLDAGPSAKRPRFPMRPQHVIQTLPTKTAYPNGEVNVKNFLNSHENEIKSLENAMRTAKKGLARRAFQDVPRELRRRTASHNPHRVPKRLRARARQEANEDNTPITPGKSGSGAGKGSKGHLRREGRETSRQKWEQRAKRRKAKDNPYDPDNKEINGERRLLHPLRKTPRFPILATPALPPSRFRRRQNDKTWLPTHVWHSKRSRMTDPKDPLWRFAIPLQPVVKGYRLAHRAATQRGAVAWDASYMATISLEGVEASIVGMLKGLHFASEESEDPWIDRGKAKKWRRGTRAREGWIYEREAKPLKKIAPITVLWCVPEAESHKRRVFIRVHPSAFLQLWNEVVRISKVQKPGVSVEDLRFELGCIEIMGPAAAEALCSILSPISAEAAPDAPQSLWPTLASVSNVGALPEGALIAFDISDPRFQDPPTTSTLSQDEPSLSSLTETLSQWPIDTSQGLSSIFDRNLRLAAQRATPSEKSINRRKSACTLGEHPEARTTDPHIPMLVYVSRESKIWTVLLPWKCVQPVWRGIMRYPVSTGGNPRFGGLKERRQLSYERSMALFPFDHPGTDAGWAWELKEREARKIEWTKRPKGKRIEWPTIHLGNGRKGEIGDPWACSWESIIPKPLIEDQKKPKDTEKAYSPLQQLSARQATQLVAGGSLAPEYLKSFYVFTAKITMIQRGVPVDCARIYRLPTNNEELRTQWLSLIPKPGSKRHIGKKPNSYSSDAPEHIKRRELARRLLEPLVQNDGPPKAGEVDYPVVPDEEDLIGFVTTGNYNLAEGMPTAVANVALHKVLDGVAEGQGKDAKRHVCIVRPAGSTTGRLAIWEMV
ncbi:ribonuclease-like protein P complex subunit Pop1 [Phaeosphaeriaceae sp. PMI808]|nr:ribonuclease-like protein P complex subunit Pop1 [Phaeosphaeriaceae sp. PMI808]